MADAAMIWVIGEPDDALDDALVEALRKGLGEGHEVVLKALPRAEGVEGVGDRLRALLGERPGPAPTLAAELSRDGGPDVLLASSPGHLRDAADAARGRAARPLRLGVVRSPSPAREWLEAPADLLAVPDEAWVASLKSKEGRSRVTGVPLPGPLEQLGDAPTARARHGLEPDAHVVLIPAGAVAPPERAQLLVQLSLVRADLEVLFEVDDAAEAEQVRGAAPTHGLGASLFSAGEGAARYWPLAHLVLGRARPFDLARARAVGSPLLALPARGAEERRSADALVESGTGRAVDSMATLAVDLDLTLEPERYEALAARQRALAVPDAPARIVALVREALDRRAELTGGEGGLPGGLERVSRPRRRSGPPRERFDEAATAAKEARDKAELWAERARLARERGEADLAVEADKRASRYHETLGRLLDRIRPEGFRPDEEPASLEDELAAMRRRVVPEDNVEQRLRRLEVEDELRALKDRLRED